jgi:IS30 family transposase
MTEINTSSNSRKNVSLYHKEREKKVLELYHVQGKTTRDIQRELEMSPNTITDILKRDREEKEKEREKKEDSVYKVGDNGNGDARSRPTTNPP